jgi:hypothetical protein
MQRNGCLLVDVAVNSCLQSGGIIAMSKVPVLFDNLRKMQMFSALSNAEMGDVIGKIED